ncbi:MAG: hypothetical protein E7343_05350 [Clostridiales bacterium]|nr:hypothetical protein [Clostridiales bacterium]
MIKKQRNKILTLLVAGAIGTAALGGVAMANGVAVDAAETYSMSTVFSTSSATLKKNGDGETGALKMEIKDAGRVSYTRDLALKWFVKEENSPVTAKYMSLSFTLADTNFEKVTLAFDTESLTATKDGKSTHEVTFTNDGTTVKVKVGDGDETEVVAPTEKFTLTLSEGASSEEFFATLSQTATVATGSFTNIGSNFAEWDSSKEMSSFVVKAETDGEKVASVLLHEINGQSLELNKDNKFTDDTAPVLVVNEDIDGFVLGTAFALDYEVIDVLDRTVTKTLKYYQYDPDEAREAKNEYDESTATDKVMKAPEYKSLSTTTYFLETNYTTSDDKLTSVYKTTGGTEYVSIQFTLTDDGNTEAVYYLDWYLGAEAETIDTSVFSAVEGYTDIGYVGVYDNDEEGAKYTCVKNEGSTSGDETVDTENVAYTEFVDALKEIEDDGLSAGEGSYLYLPSLKYLITDNGGYSNLKFTISYKSTSNNTAKTSSSLSSSALKLEVTQAGVYEFKVFAVDKAGNNMKYYDAEKEEIVDVTSSNVWDIDAIPSFSIKVANNGIKVEEGTSKKDSEVIYGDYDLSDFDVVGPASAISEYKLFYVDQSKVSGITTSKLTGITYGTLASVAKNLKETATERGVDLYKLAYATELKTAIGGEVTVEQILDALVEIKEFNDKIKEEDHPDDWANSDNAYQWDATAKTFVPQKMGNYLIIACFTDPDIVAYDAGAYKLITVQSEEDVIYGETEWLKNNMVSVILFGIAGLMLILIIILLVVKPSDETLEDIDGASKKEKKEKKTKKADEKVLEELDVNEK